MSDTELWQAWCDRGDADAFTSLVDRYLDMVYATARRVLGNSHDAEEVTQECFITLLQGRVKVQHPLGPWLHRVARNRALDRIKGETRRREREQKWQETTLEDTTVTIDDVLTHVDAAIDALPPDVRSAIVGRFLEGKTNASLGEAQGVGESTIRARVNRGVDLIRENLKQRGVVLRAAALGALLENNLAEAASADLRATVAKLALATPKPKAPPRWVAGSKGMAGMAVGMLVLGALGYGLVSGHVADLFSELGWFGMAQPVVTVTSEPVSSDQPPPRPDFAADEATPALSKPPAEATPTRVESPPVPDWDEPVSTVSGTIYDERGYPLPGAIVTVASKFTPDQFERMQVFSAVTSEDGTYIVEGIRHFLFWEGFSEIHRANQPVEHRGLHTFDRPNPYGVLNIHVSAPGYQTQGEQHPVEAGTHKEGVEYTMEPGFTVRGQVVWPDGEPLAHAGIGLRRFMALEGYSSGGYNQIASTDDTGHFLLGVPAAGTMAIMVVAGQQQSFFNHVPAEENTIPKLAMRPNSLLHGTVRKDDGSPVPDLFVTVTGRFGIVDEPAFEAHVISHDELKIGHAFTASDHTDAQGRFTMPPMAAVPDAVLTVYESIPQKPGKKLLTKHLGPLEPGEKKSVDIVLPGASETMTLIATVLGEQSGRPLPYTSVKLRNEDTGKDLAMATGFEAPYYPTEIDLTEPGVYLVWPHYNNLNMGEERDAYGQQLTWEAGTRRDLTFRIPDPFALAVTVVDASGNPVADADVESVGNHADIRTDQTNADGVFRWDGFAPARPAWFRVSKEGYWTDETRAHTGVSMDDVVLEPLVLHRSGGVEGRVVDADGTPLANAIFSLSYATDAITWRVHQQETNRVGQNITTDDEGTFTILDALPAFAGEIKLQGMGPSAGLHTDGAVAVDLVAGEVLGLGDIVVIDGSAHE